ncbi:CHAP domain-containing protein [Nocardia sp. NPDC003345]
MSPTKAEPIDTTLSHPDGSSPGLDAIIDASQESLRKSVLTLATGDTGNQQDLVDWLEDKGLLSDKGLKERPGESMMAEGYSTHHKEITDRAAELRRQNDSVDSSRFLTLSTTNKTFKEIRTTVSELQSTLANAPAPRKGEDGIYRLSAATEIGLIAALLTAVDRVDSSVADAQGDIDTHARTIAASVPSVPSGGGITTAYTATAGPSGFSNASYVVTDPDDPVGSALDLARSQLGVSEFANNRVDAPYNINDAWCASFTSWLWEKAGYDVDWTNKNYVPAIWNDANSPQMDLAARASEAQPGDLIVFDWKGDGTPDHIGIVESVQGGRIHTIEGNSSDRVQRNDYAMGSGQIVGVVKQPPTKSTAISV